MWRLDSREGRLRYATISVASLRSGGRTKQGVGTEFSAGFSVLGYEEGLRLGSQNNSLLFNRRVEKHATCRAMLRRRSVKRNYPSLPKSPKPSPWGTPVSPSCLCGGGSLKKIVHEVRDKRHKHGKSQ